MLIIKPKYKKKIAKSSFQIVEVVSGQGADEREHKPSEPKRKRIDNLINGKGIIYE